METWIGTWGSASQRLSYLLPATQAANNEPADLDHFRKLAALILI